MMSLLHAFIHIFTALHSLHLTAGPSLAASKRKGLDVDALQYLQSLDEVVTRQKRAASMPKRLLPWQIMGMKKYVLLYIFRTVSVQYVCRKLENFQLPVSLHRKASVQKPWLSHIEWVARVELSQ
jgi:hypothetical protein